MGCFTLIPLFPTGVELDLTLSGQGDVVPLNDPSWLLSFLRIDGNVRLSGRNLSPSENDQVVALDQMAYHPYPIPR